MAGYGCFRRLPPEAESYGEAAVISGPDGRPFDWNEIFEGLLKIYWSPSRPADAAIAVPYQGN